MASLRSRQLQNGVVVVGGWGGGRERGFGPNFGPHWIGQLLWETFTVKLINLTGLKIESPFLLFKIECLLWLPFLGVGEYTSKGLVSKGSFPGCVHPEIYWSGMWKNVTGFFPLLGFSVLRPVLRVNQNPVRGKGRFNKERISGTRWHGYTSLATESQSCPSSRRDGACLGPGRGHRSL